MRLFSDLRWKEVVGMVLVDPSVEHQDRAFAARRDIQQVKEPDLASIMRGRHRRDRSLGQERRLGRCRGQWFSPPSIR